ncbi:facilitated trehalose transporter Tret1-like [Sitophilus oryzae]|uniref:Facilitated trehalose transporter Tret1-like n=1 Tax=Sitophilus oryzae TaxID=7048 RepID=A0A6J2Y737_SITOR|nr:facilitated trehalose transporter Tret1-like [Sitophilus oryzae]XP_030759653.1 facilitated trehalose transporter Tret1-like [Sitophilus oryzae]
MDPIGSSCYNLHVEENANLEEDEGDKFAEIIVSVRSLSKYEGRSFKSMLPQVAGAAIAASFHFVVGVSLAYSAILIPHLNTNFTNQTSDDIIATKTETSWIASSTVLVSPIGGITGGFLMDSVGRLNTLKLAAIPSIIGWITIATANNVPMLIIGRVLTGLGSSWGTSPAIVYITEIARVDARGSLISFSPAYASLGMMVAFLKGYFLSWRTVAWLCLIYSILPIILIQFFIKESPPWLVAKGRVEEAAKSLNWINKNQPHPDQRPESLAELHLQLLQKEHQLKMEEESRKGTGFIQKCKLFLKPTGYKPLLLLFALFFFQQFSGIYIMLFYSITFFKETGSAMDGYLASVLIGTIRFLMSCINTYMLKTFHRRPLIVVSGVSMAICMVTSGFFTKWIHEGTTTHTWVPTLLILVYVITTMIGLLPIPWTMTAELFPIEIRGVAHSIAYSAANLLMFASVQMFYTLQDWFGGIVGLQWFFAVVSVMASIYTFIFLPETHGKKLSEITNYFATSGGLYLCSEERNKKKSNKKTPKIVSRVPQQIIKSNTQTEKLLNRA